MGVYIKDIRMPKDGDVLTVKKDDDGKIYIKQSHNWGYSAEVIELPPHGRLIDADALVRDNGIKEIPEYYEVVCAAPTVIPAEVRTE